MNAPSSLTTVLEHAQRLRDEALAACVQAEEALRKLRLQLEQLSAYSNEYQARDPARNGKAAPIDVLRRHLMFMARLNQAATQHQGQLQAAQHQVQARREVLTARETRVAALEKLLHRRARDTARRADRAAQGQDDEFAARRRWRDTSGAPTNTP